MREYKYSSRATNASRIAGYCGWVAGAVLFFGILFLGDFVGLNGFLAFLISLVAATASGFGFYAYFDKLAQEWGREDTILYYKEHPQEYAELLARVKAEQESTLKKFY